ncbi:MAG: hypothetical protein NPIRA06_03570 [Nitrospirales bacterium]|nr:MAG: hypothetical protein NPIRA06_03570 [Nitrospirales bacterium]
MGDHGIFGVIPGQNSLPGTSQRYCQLKSIWADFLPRPGNLNAEQLKNYEFINCLMFVKIQLT